MPPFGSFEAQIHCADCGTETTAKRKNQKYCGVCRLVRNIKFVGAKQKVCICCEQKFAPLTVNDSVCPNCDDVGLSTDVMDCALCHRTTNVIKNGIRVCRFCAYDPAKRETFHAALLKRKKEQKQRQEVSA